MSLKWIQLHVQMDISFRETQQAAAEQPNKAVITDDWTA